MSEPRPQPPAGTPNVPAAAPADPAALLAAARARTPARVFAGRAGPAYPTATQLALRRDHAAARDAVHDEVELSRDLGPALVEEFGLFEVATRAASKAEFLLRPDLGRRLSDDGRAAVAANCPTGPDVQVVVGDGLSAAAVRAQVPRLLPLLAAGARERGRRFGRPFFVRHCRVGVLNDVGDLLGPDVVVLLIGERPGLATAESLSAYLAFRPRPGDTDANRNLLSNIHARGVPPEEAAPRILSLIEQMRRLGTSGVAVKEVLTPPGGQPALPPHEI